MADDVSTLIAKNLKLFRERLGWSQATLAEHSGVPRPTIAHLEAGQANPTLSVALRVARALGISIDGLVEATDDGIVTWGPADFPAVRTGRIRRTELASALSVREGVFERIVLRGGGKLRFGEETDSEGGLIFVSEGRVLLRHPNGEESLEKEHAAWFRVPVDVSAVEGSTLYRLSGVTHSPNPLNS